MPARNASRHCQMAMGVEGGAQPSLGKDHRSGPFILGGWSVSLKGKAWESRVNDQEQMALSGHPGAWVVWKVPFLRG